MPRKKQSKRKTIKGGQFKGVKKGVDPSEFVEFYKEAHQVEPEDPGLYERYNLEDIYDDPYAEDDDDKFFDPEPSFDVYRDEDDEGFEDAEDDYSRLYDFDEEGFEDADDSPLVNPVDRLSYETIDEIGDFGEDEINFDDQVVEVVMDYPTFKSKTKQDISNIKRDITNMKKKMDTDIEYPEFDIDKVLQEIVDEGDYDDFKDGKVIKQQLKKRIKKFSSVPDVSGPSKYYGDDPVAKKKPVNKPVKKPPVKKVDDDDDNYMSLDTLFDPPDEAKKKEGMTLKELVKLAKSQKNIDVKSELKKISELTKSKKKPVANKKKTGNKSKKNLGIPKIEMKNDGTPKDDTVPEEDLIFVKLSKQFNNKLRYNDSVDEEIGEQILKEGNANKIIEYLKYRFIKGVAQENSEMLLAEDDDDEEAADDAFTRQAKYKDFLIVMKDFSNNKEKVINYIMKHKAIFEYLLDEDLSDGFIKYFSNMKGKTVNKPTKNLKDRLLKKDAPKMTVKKNVYGYPGMDNFTKKAPVATLKEMRAAIKSIYRNNGLNIPVSKLNRNQLSLLMYYLGGIDKTKDAVKEFLGYFRIPDVAKAYYLLRSQDKLSEVEELRERIR